MKQYIVVTGAGGLLGRHITDYLYLQGNHVIPVYHNTVLNKYKGLQLNLLYNEFHNILDKIKINTLIHCAAAIPQTFDGENAIRVAGINRKIDDNIIEYCERRKIRLVYMSSCSLYGFNHQGLKNERLTVNPIGYYGQEKYNSEEKISDSEIPQSVVLRISSPYGIYQKHQTVLKLFLEKALSNEDILYHGSGMREQDFVNAMDIAFAVGKIIDQRDVNGVFNIASGWSFSMKELAEVVVKTVGSKSRVRSSKQQDEQDGYKVKIDINKAKEVFSWESKFSLEQGITSWANYLRNQL